VGSSHFGAAAITFIAAEVLKLTFVEQLFQLNRNKLLSGKPDLAFHIQKCRPKKPATKITTTTTPMM
jgi:hypothetical protein